MVSKGGLHGSSGGSCCPFLCSSGALPLGLVRPSLERSFSVPSGPRWHDVALVEAAPAWLLWLVCLAELEGEGWEGVRVAWLDARSVAR